MLARENSPSFSLDASLSQGYPNHLVRRCPFIRMDGVRHCGCKVSWLGGFVATGNNREGRNTLSKQRVATDRF